MTEGDVTEPEGPDAPKTPQAPEDIEALVDAQQGAWVRIRAWATEHRGPLLLAGVGLGAVALRSRGGARVLAGSAAAVTTAATTAATASKTAVEIAAENSERVYREFMELGPEYLRTAMDQTVDQATRRFQRWDAHELEVLRDPSRTALEKAFELKRTFEGVKAKAIKEGFSSKVP